MKKLFIPVLLTVFISSAIWADPIDDVVSIVGNDVPINLAWDEDSDGDLGSSFHDEDTANLDLQVGLNMVVGNWRYIYTPVGSQRDFDSFNFSLPNNTQITAVIYAYDVVITGDIVNVVVEHTLVSDTDCYIYDYDCYQSYLNDPKDYFAISVNPPVIDLCENFDPCPWADRISLVTSNYASDVHNFDFDGAIPFQAANGGIAYTGFPNYLLGGFPAGPSLDYAWGLLVSPVYLPVDIVVKPGDDQECININNRGVIPVAILGSESLDVAQIDDNTLTFGSMPVAVRKKKGPMCGLELLGSDDYPDLVCHFEDHLSLWNAEDGVAELSGLMLDGTEISGTSDVCIKP